MSDFQPYEGDKPYIYVSYSRIDKEKLIGILRKLNAMGFRVWYDKGIQLVNLWQIYNARHIKNCQVFMFFISKNSIKSEECKKEILYAGSLNKAILPIYLEEIKEIEAGLEFNLTQWQSFFLYKYDGFEYFYDEIISTNNLRSCQEPGKWTTPADNFNQSQNDTLNKALNYYKDKNFFKAAQIFENLANNGNTEAMRYFGWMHLLGEISKGKFITGLYWLDRASDNGNDDAMNQLGVIYQEGNFVTKDLARAEEYFRKAAEKGNLWGMYNLGCMYLEGEFPKEKIKEGVIWLAKSADKGNADAINVLANLYYKGEILVKNKLRAAEYYKNAAKLGNHWGMYNLGCMYLEGEIPNSVPFDGVKWLEEAAQLGNAEAMNRLGILVYKGNIAKKNLELAEIYFQNAANAGNHWGTYNLAYMYLEQKRFQEGIGLLYDAANQGNVSAMSDLSRIYAQGNYGVKRNSDNAEYWRQMAINNGYVFKSNPSFLGKWLRKLFN